jgi:L-ribulose-5-phosphate 4-epimerase
MTVHAELRERVCEAHRELVRTGLVVLTFGNASAIDRDAGLVAIKPSGVPYDALDPDAIVLVDLDTGEPVDDAYRPSSDTPTHLVLYRRFATVGGVVHTHSPHATAWAQACRPIPCLGTTHADHFNGPVPVARPLRPDELADEYELRTGEVIAETVEGLGLDPLELPAVLVASHGPFTWGANVEQALENAVALELVASMAFETVALKAEAERIDDALRQRHYLRKHGASAYYGQPGRS